MASVERSQHLADAVEARRKALGLTVSDLQERTGLSGQALLNVRRGDVRRYQERLTVPLTRSLGWTSDSIERLLAGQDPIEVEPAPAEADRVDEVLDAFRQAVAKSSSRDARLSDVVKVTSETSAVLMELADVVRANREQLALIADHLGVEVVPAPPRAAPSPTTTDPRH